MASKLHTGHPSLRLQFLEKRSVLYVRIETFDVSVYDRYHATWFSEIMNLPGKKVEHRVLHFLLREYPGKR